LTERRAQDNWPVTQKGPGRTGPSLLRYVIAGLRWECR